MCRRRHALHLALLLGIGLAAPDSVRALGVGIAAAPVVVSGDRFSVTVSGRGPDVILIPGLASAGNVWDATAAHLGPHHRVHVVQIAGFGGSAPGGNAEGPVLGPVVAGLHDYITAYKLRGAAVIGHSLGGLIAMKLAIDHPGDAGRLMIVDALPFYGLTIGPGMTVPRSEPFARILRDRVRAGTQEAYAAGASRSIAGLVKSKGPATDAAVTAAAASDHRVVAQAIYDDATTDLRPDLARITVPVTMLYPWDAAKGGSAEAGDRLYATAFAPLAQARLERIDGSFHFIMIDQPAAFEREVDAFLAR